MNKYVTIELGDFKDLLVEENKGVYGSFVEWIKSELSYGTEVDDLSDSKVVEIITTLIDDFIGSYSFTISEDQIDWIANEVFKELRTS